MKIEICEQMVQSWLTNIKQCQVVETNWSISPLHNILQKDIDDAYEFVNNVQEILNNTLEAETVSALQTSVDEETEEKSSYDDVVVNTAKKSKKATKLNIIKKSTANQFIRQCEIDVVGIRLDDGIVDRVFLVDSAFHKGGLGYHDVVATVIKKLIRAVLVSTIVFGSNVDVTVAFAAPDCRPKPLKEIIKVVDMLRPLLVGKYSKISLEVYINEGFTKEIFEPLEANTKNLNNDNDLFMRALNLIESAKSHATPAPAPVLTSSPAKAKAPKGSTKATASKSSLPTIVYIPSDLNVFKANLMTSHRAEITWIYNDGTRKSNLWYADKIKPTTNIPRNIQSRPRWRDKDVDGLKEVFVKVL